MRLRTIDLFKLGVTLLVTALLIGALMPVASHAIDGFVTIRDGQDDRVAVDGRKLRVGDGNGAMTVNGNVRARGHEATGVPVHVELFKPNGFESASSATTPTYTVPAGKRLIITHVSGTTTVDTTERVYLVQVYVGSDDLIQVPVAPGWNSGVSHLQSFTTPFDIAVLAGQSVKMTAFRTDNDSGFSAFTGHVAGYLVPE